MVWAHALSRDSSRAMPKSPIFTCAQQLNIISMDIRECITHIGIARITSAQVIMQQRNTMAHSDCAPPCPLLSRKCLRASRHDAKCCAHACTAGHTAAQLQTIVYQPQPAPFASNVCLLVFCCTCYLEYHSLRQRPYAPFCGRKQLLKRTMGAQLPAQRVTYSGA
jgi:hypothetical protein